jgi:hypothetical protein
MPSLADLENGQISIILSDNSILEPLSPPTAFVNNLTRFGEHYDLSVDSHLYRFLLALAGDGGAGSLKKEMLLPKLQQKLDSTFFRDLDRLYGTPLGLPRMSAEIYEVDPHNEALTQDQWRDVKVKDALYRNRCLSWMRALMAGPTKKGLQLAAQAAIGVECDIVEHYQYIDNQASDDPISLTNFGTTNSRSEFVIIPRAPTVTQEERRRIVHLVDRLRPVNSLPTVSPTGDNIRIDRPCLEVDTTSESFYVTRTVTGRQDVDWPEPDPAQGFWIVAGEAREAPTTAFNDKQESITYVSIASIESSSKHTGSFNRQQRNLFAHLSEVLDPFLTFEPDSAIATATVPLQIGTVWTTR